MITERSAELNELFGALSELQGSIEGAKKDRSGFKNQYKFADLAQYIDLSKDSLKNLGLCVLQCPGHVEVIEIDSKETVSNGPTEKQTTFHRVKVPKQSIYTWIGHKSGQYIGFSMDILVEKLAGMTWGQSTGSAITYARRYSRAGALGMSQEDDDNQNAKQSLARQSYAVPNNNQSSIANSNIKATKEQIDELLLKLNGDEVKINKIMEWGSVKNIYDLSFDKYSAAINKINSDENKTTGGNA